MQNQDLKLNINRILVIRAPKDNSEGKTRRMNSFKEKVSHLSMIDEVATSGTTPGESYRYEIYFSKVNSDTPLLLYMNTIDEDFFGLYQVKFLAGKNFSGEHPFVNKNRIILNRSAALQLGFENVNDAIGEKVKDYEDSSEYEITGIVDDYHQLYLKEGIEPQSFRFNQRTGDYSLKINRFTFADPRNMQNCISALSNIWKDIYRDLPFNYYFLDDQYNAQFEDDNNFEKLFSVFSGISIVIACSGLFGLSLFVSLKRKKEVGVRKVFGASSSLILILVATLMILVHWLC